MTKIQKIWLWIFIAMFAIPEILWSPIANFIYSFFEPLKNGYSQLFRNNFLFNYKYENLLKLVIFIQSTATVLFLTFLFKNKNNIKSKITFWITLIISLLVCLITLFVFYLVFLFNPDFIL